LLLRAALAMKLTATLTTTCNLDPAYVAVDEAAVQFAAPNNLFGGF
jgi:hypothetical protein